MTRMFACTALLALAVTACQQQDPNNFAIDEGNALNADIETLPADESSLNNVEAAAQGAATPAPPPPAPPATDEASPGGAIPAQYRGRWGMTQADCQAGRSDAKGLMRIEERTIRFYESVATLKEQRPAIATSFSGLFAFSGEGQKWEKVMTFTRTGDMLKRAEESGSFTYRRCA